MSNNWKVFFSTPIKIGGILGEVFGFVADVLKPLADIGHYFFIAGFIAILISLILYSVPFCNKPIKLLLKDYWYAPFFITVTIFSTLLLVSNYASKEYGDPNRGYIAKNVFIFEKLQNDIFILMSSHQK